MFPRRWELAFYGAVFSIALAMRLWDLGARAVHHDESLHGYFS
jgi:predicted membrane-bound mannosyltransferase